jgi:salicylate hydroxylase
MPRTPRIAIIGGGIGGLTAAVARHQRNIEIEVYEQSAQIGEIGAGVSLSPNAVKAYRALGLEAPVAAAGFESDHQVVRSWNTGKIVSQVYRKGVYEREFGAPYLSIHRADLVDILHRALPDRVFRLGARCVEVATSDTGACARFADGTQIEADLVVGADGIHSAVRRSLFGQQAPRFTGSVCWRGLVPLDAFPSGLISTDLTLYMGPRSHVIHFMVRGGKLVNFVAHVETDAWTGESWTQECDRSEVTETFAGWHEPLLRLLGSAEHYYKWALHDRDPLDRWSKGRATLLGDSAHAMLPHIGQGACMAIEDGYALGHGRADAGRSGRSAAALRAAARAAHAPCRSGGAGARPGDALDVAMGAAQAQRQDGLAAPDRRRQDRHPARRILRLRRRGCHASAGRRRVTVQLRGRRNTARKGRGH